MKRLLPAVLILAIAFGAGGTLLAQLAPADNIPNWSVPATWSPSQASGGYRTMTDISDAIPFVAISPCRIADTRGINGFGGQAGGPIIPSNTTRVFNIDGAPATVPAPPNGCAANAIPVGADAVSFQFTIVSPTADGNLIAWNGGAIPQVSVLNWAAGTVALGNGTIVPLSSIGDLSVRLNMAAGQSAHLVIDVNGYFSDDLNLSTKFDLEGNDSAEMMRVINNNTSSGADGIRATQNSLGLAFGVFGLHNAATGEGYGVGGETDSITPDSAGVSGIGPGNAVISTADLSSAGVRGEDAGSEFGVIGAAETHTVNVTNAAVGGYLLNNGLATVAASGFLGRRSCIAVFGGQICSTHAGYFAGNVHVTGNLSASGTKPFIEPTAADPTKAIRYVAMEGPEAGTYFRGRARFSRGIARITVPAHFREVSDPDSLSVQITPIGEMATYAVVKADLDEIVVRASRNVEFYYTVNSVRRAYKDYPVIVDSVFLPETANARMPEIFPPEIQRRLIAAGVYNEDGSVNMETAERLGLAKGWAEAAEFRAAEAEKNND